MAKTPPRDASSEPGQGEAPGEGQAPRKTPTYVEAVRSSTPGGSTASTTASGMIKTPDASPRITTPSSNAVAPPPRNASPISSAVTMMGTVSSLTSNQPGAGPNRHPTPGNPAPTRNATPSGSDPFEGVPEELTVKHTGSARTRIGLPSITPGMFRKRDDVPTPGLRRSDEPRSATPRGGRETVLLTAVKRPNTTPASSPAISDGAVRSESSRGDSGGHIPGGPSQGSRGTRTKRTRPAVPPAQIRATKHRVLPTDSLVLLDQKMVPQGAAIRSLRHRLAEKGDPRVILVSSAGPKEGKTFCAANLALALAEIRRSRVLLVDGNVHHHALATLFGIDKPPSVFAQMELHRREPSAPWNVAELSTYDMHLLAADATAEAPPAIEGALFTSCIDGLRGAYDYIIVDGPSVSDGPEVSLMEDGVDGIVFVARTDRSNAKALRNALDQISPQDLLGVVLLEA